MLSHFDSISNRTGLWPHVVLSGHAHNYQRFTRSVGSTSVQSIVAGMGGAKLLRGPGQHAGDAPSPDIAVRYSDFEHPGYLRLIADPKQLHVEFQAAGSDASTVDWRCV